MRTSGFALIQMAVVLIIIGLVIGGILAGKDLINHAAVSAQISQINKYQAAVTTFQTKYIYLPGDIPSTPAAQAGLQARGTQAGEGDGNGILEGNCSNTNGGNSGTTLGCGELAVFWQDLSTVNMIDATIGSGSNYPNISSSPSPSITLATTPSVQNWLPTAKLGQGNFVYVMSFNGLNYFVVQKVSKIGNNVESTGTIGAGVNAMTVQQAYSIDSKIDDGLPQSGMVIACDSDKDVNSGGGLPVWAAGNSNWGAGGNGCAATTTATPYATTNCFDNNNVAGTQAYSIVQNANAMNCALSFQFNTQ